MLTGIVQSLYSVGSLSAVVEDVPRSPRRDGVGASAPQAMTNRAIDNLKAVDDHIDFYQPNEQIFWKTLENTTIPVSRSAANAGTEGVESGRETLREHLSSRDRLFDILYFKNGLPFMSSEVSQRIVAKRPNAGSDGVSLSSGSGHHVPGSLSPPRPLLPAPLNQTHPHATLMRAKPTAPAGASEPVTVEVVNSLVRLKDTRSCLVSQGPTLLYPTVPGQPPAWEEMALECAEGCACCTFPRAKKELGNYRNSGFCKQHVEGTGVGSVANWYAKDRRTVRGFNIRRAPGETKMRHFLCFEREPGMRDKIFLKWCTQCHLWKNFLEFSRDGHTDKPKMDTFCRICHNRQTISRSKQLEKRRLKKRMEWQAGSGPKRTKRKA